MSQMWSPKELFSKLRCETVGDRLHWRLAPNL